MALEDNSTSQVSWSQFFSCLLVMIVPAVRYAGLKSKMSTDCQLVWVQSSCIYIAIALAKRIEHFVDPAVSAASLEASACVCDGQKDSRPQLISVFLYEVQSKS